MDKLPALNMYRQWTAGNDRVCSTPAPELRLASILPVRRLVKTCRLLDEYTWRTHKVTLVCAQPTGRSLTNMPMCHISTGRVLYPTHSATPLPRWLETWRSALPDQAIPQGGWCLITFMNHPTDSLPFVAVFDKVTFASRRQALSAVIEWNSSCLSQSEAPRQV